MQIIVKLWSGKSIAFEVEPTDSIKIVKSKIQDKIKVIFPPGMVRLECSGMQLKDDCTVSDYKINEESTIHVLLRLLSCRSCPGTQNGRDK